MFKSASVLILSLSLTAPVFAQQQKAGTEPAGQKSAPTSEAGFISPSEINIILAPDVRTFVVMAAINVAGFDFETGGQSLSPARAQLRRDLERLDPTLKGKLAAFYKKHRREGVDEAVDAARYAALSLLMSQPPAFSISQKAMEDIPSDLKPLTAFVPLVQEFYVKGGLRELAPKYLGVGEAYAAAYRKPVGQMVFETLRYFNTVPQTIINMQPFVVKSGADARGNKKESLRVIERNRTRHVFIIHDPLTALDTSIVRGDILNQKEDLLVRRIGDDYNVIIGPAQTPNMNAVLPTMIRFIIDPLIERHLKESLKFKDEILKLVSSIPTAQEEYSSSVYLVVRESLAQAAEARMRMINAKEVGGNYKEDDAIFDLSQAYLRGAALVFHFYDSLKGLEQVGINIEDFFDEMVATTKFEREVGRAVEFEPIVARVSAARNAAASKPAVEPDPLAKKLLLSDDLLQQRRLSEARPVLEEILTAAPNNARALYGLAQIVSQVPSEVESDPNSDENDKIQAQYTRLKQALNLFDKAIEKASPETERWLIQWSYVFKGRILDFQEFRADALIEYEKALKMGPVPNGAEKEALEGKQKPYGQKQPGN